MGGILSFLITLAICYYIGPYILLFAVGIFLILLPILKIGLKIYILILIAFTAIKILKKYRSKK